MVAFVVKLDQFDGPIDLLLHLVKQQELPIEKISLAQVTSQYLGCIAEIRDLDLEIAGEYLVIAATLVSIKSSVLLNEPVELITDEDGNLINPHDELLRKLREAAIYREGAQELSRRHLLGIDVFQSSAPVMPGEEPEVVFKNHDALLLGKAFQKILQKAGAPMSLMTISVDPISIVERMIDILDILKGAPTGVSFVSLISNPQDRGVIVSTFLALLELCKRQVMQVRQDELFDEIYVVLASADVDAAALTSEYDTGGALANG